MEPLTELEKGLAADVVAVRLRAAEQAAHLGSEAQPLAMALVRACGDTEEEVRNWASAALEELGPPRLADLAALAHLLADDHEEVSYWAATLLGRLEAEAAAAVPDLVHVLEQSASLAVRQRAAWALGRIGPAARAATPALKEASTSNNPRLARLAARALVAIEKDHE